MDDQTKSALHVTAPITTKVATLAKAAIERDYTGRHMHSVGQIVHNLHKIKRVLQKTNFPSMPSDDQLE
jgi:septation ring formation regulator EzrA